MTSAAEPADRLAATTRLAVLVGDPVAHSVSPSIHNAGFRALGLDLAYLACRVAPQDLARAVAGLHALGAIGVNVTVPHKQAAVPLAASASREVVALGATNTLVRTAEGWHAENTDVEGFLAPLKPYVPSLRGARVVVLGAGGAARAVVYGVLRDLQPSRVTVLARRPEQAEQLLQSVTAPRRTVDIDARPWAEGTTVIREAALLVHTTPLGTGRADETPWPQAEVLGPGQIVYDLVYRPPETRLLRDARARGATVLGGLPMLLSQAAAAFRLWTGHDLPLDAAEAAARHALAS